MSPGEAEAAARDLLGRFLSSFTAADAGGIPDLFWPDALVWGTTMTELATGPDAVRAYFAPIGTRRPGERPARWREGRVLAATGEVAILSGLWEVGNTTPPLPLRLALTVVRRGDAWRILQFHSSRLP